MTIRANLKTSLAGAMKSGDTRKTAALRLIAAALKDRDIAARSKGNTDGINDDETLAMLQTMIKQRQESAKMYRDAGRDELAEAEEGEIAIIMGFLPEQLDEAATATAIDEALAAVKAESVKDMGKVMAHLKAEYAGRMDFGAVGGMVKDRLLAK